MGLKRILRDIHWVRIVAALLDFCSFQVALVIGYLLWVRFPWHGNWQYFKDFAVILWILPPLAIVVFKGIGLYKPEMGVIGVYEQTSIFKGIWITYFTVLAFSFFYREIQFSRLATLYSMFFAIVFISTERYFVRRLAVLVNQWGIGVKRAVIYGAGFNGQRLNRWIKQSPQLGINIIGFLDDQVESLVKKPEDKPILGGISELPALAKLHDLKLLFIAHRELEEDTVIEIVQLCRMLKIRCWVMPSLYRFHVERVELQNIGGIPLVGFKENFGRNSYEWLKGFLDRLLGVFLITMSMPLWLSVAAGIWFTSGGPIFFKQVRIGKNNKRFVIYKFRTLKPTQDKEAISPELLQKKAGDKSITPFGAFLRRTGLDEIPQLINVLKGEMSLVGPRPEMPFLVEKYGPLEKERLTVKPGITGLWQISEDRKRLLIHENMDYDLYYVEHMGFNLDLAILVKTAASLFKRVVFKEKKTAAIQAGSV